MHTSTRQVCRPRTWSLLACALLIPSLLLSQDKGQQKQKDTTEKPTRTEKAKQPAEKGKGGPPKQNATAPSGTSTKPQAAESAQQREHRPSINPHPPAQPPSPAGPPPATPPTRGSAKPDAGNGRGTGRSNDAGRPGSTAATGAAPQNAQTRAGTNRGTTRGIAGGNRTDARSDRGPVYSPPPQAGIVTTTRSDGSRSHFDPRTNVTVRTDQRGQVIRVERPGVVATGFQPNGYATHIDRVRPGGEHLVIERGLRGDRRVTVAGPRGERVFVSGRVAYVERPMAAGYVSRTYVIGRRTEVRIYRPYVYRSVHYVTYVPTYYYRPAYYRWMVRPWPGPVVFAWGWAPASPWFYSGYFAPAPYYPSPLLWLTDFLLAANLQAAYDAQQQAIAEQQLPPPPPPPPGYSGTTLTPEIRQAIAAEVAAQLQAQQDESTTPPPAALQPTAEAPPPALTQRVFVISTSLDVVGSNGQRCALTAGDIIERVPGQSVTDDGNVPVAVMTSKPGDCPADFLTQLDVATLQDIQNEFRRQLSSGMAELSARQGTNLPAAGVATDSVPSGVPAASAGQDAQLISRVTAQADSTDADVVKATRPPPP